MRYRLSVLVGLALGLPGCTPPPRVEPTPPEYAKLEGTRCLTRPGNDFREVWIEDPRHVGSLDYKVEKNGVVSHSNQPMRDVPIEKQQVRPVMEFKSLFLIRNQQGTYFLPIVYLPSHQMGSFFTMYVDALHPRSTYVASSSVMMHLNIPQPQHGEDLVLLIRCPKEDDQWHIVDADRVLQEKRVKIDDVLLFPKLEEHSERTKIEELIDLAKRHPYENALEQ
jgi:hypothetical protein